MKSKFILFFFLVSCGISAQGVSAFLTPSDSLNVTRRNSVLISEAALAAGTFAALNQFWYADYPKSAFHFTNDNADWLQMDKAGHVFSGYHLSNYSANALKWSGVSAKKSAIYGALSGFVVLSTVEVFDGYSSNWGASAGDLAANASGVALFVSQELLWGEQRIIPKFSFHATPYASARPEVLGSTYSEQILKDYNGQTYWLSANAYSFFKQSAIPKWINLAVGYGAEGMITGSDQIVNTVFLPEKKRFRQFYLSLDVEMSKIETKSHVLKTLFSVINVVKIPAPTLEFNSKGIVKFHPLYF